MKILTSVVAERVRNREIESEGNRKKSYQHLFFS